MTLADYMLDRDPMEDHIVMSNALEAFRRMQPDKMMIERHGDRINLGIGWLVQTIICDRGPQTFD